MGVVHMIVHGTVQGVGFRSMTQQLAANHDIKGWVKNKADGTVEIEAEGSQEDLNRFIDKIKQGPSPYASVENIEMNTVNSSKDFDTFKVL
ncbi:acylphosphatase [Thalassobacillus hwangdonensis]|uniref:Acylphosphatase n=1 Tax=Thalassobacillus hwangdonensis TaxID=546108 RepID=A0ABW3L1F2_9BACI